MPISVVCSGCQKRLKAPDTAAGKQTKCPACQSLIQIPSVQASARKDSWTVQTEGGDSYGPVTKVELDQWVKEGRLDDNCQVLQEGAPQWQWASDIYPELATPANQPGQSAAADPFAAAANPYGAAGGGQASYGLAGPAAFQQPAPTTGYPGQGYPSQSFGSGQPSFASANPYAPGAMTGQAQKRASDASAGIVTIAVFNFILSGLSLLCGGCSALGAFGSVMLFSSVEGEGAEAAGAVGGIMFVVFIVVALLYFAFGIMLLMGGVGLLKRENWGRVLTLICAGLAGLAALLNIFGFLSGEWTSIVGFFMNAGYCVAAFCVLLSPGANQAFRKKRRR